MKLLSVNDVQSEKKRQQELDAFKAAYVTEQLILKTKELSQVDQKIKETREKEAAALDLYVAEIEAKKAALRNEVGSLEARRKAALEPIDAQKKEVQRLLVAQKEKERELQEREDALDRKQSLLRRLGDRLEDKEADLDDKEVDILQRLRVVESKESNLKQAEEVFNKRVDESRKDYETKLQELVEKERVLTAGMEWVSRREEAYQKEKAQLEKDREYTQDLMNKYVKKFEELKAKNLI